MTLAPTLMIQGTASSVGKSLMVTALCRIFARRGLRVAPFKAQNMSLNAAVTLDGLEIGRAQAVQAEAAGIPASVLMNPILLKPESDSRCQVVVMGKSRGVTSALAYGDYQATVRHVVGDCLAKLRATHDLVLIEGAGSPAEVNLKERDLVNMYVAKLVSSPVLLCGDIDRGGVFAALVGTLALLEPDERALVAGFIINKFRGDVSLLKPGLDFLEARVGKPVLGVVPYLRALGIADEDSVALEERMRSGKPARELLDIVVLRLPHIANYDDVLELEHEPGVVVRFVDDAAGVHDADLVIVPGSKSTVADLAWLRALGLAQVLEARAERGAPVLGICGGFQMLGLAIEDPDGAESTVATCAGLGLLPVVTSFAREKLTAQAIARGATPSFLLPAPERHTHLTGYEIHMGHVQLRPGARPAFELQTCNGLTVSVHDGAVSPTGNVVGTLLHGIFADASLRSEMLAGLRARRGLPSPAPSPAWANPYDRLADAVEQALDMTRIAKLIESQPAP